MESLIKYPRLGWDIGRQNVISILLFSLYTTIGLIALGDYLAWTSVNFIIGMATLPLLFSNMDQSKVTYRWAIMGSALLLINLCVPVKTLLYLALCSILLFVYESRGRKIMVLPFMALFLISPVCQYFAHIFSFPVRLWLTGVAGDLLRNMGQQVSVAGNMISCSTGEYSVDPACMGLNMLVTSFLCGLALLAIYQKKASRILGLQWIVPAFLLIFGLNICANLVRILLLVYFRLLPGNPMHGLSGILCLIVYVLLPAAFVLKKMVFRLGKPVPEPQVASPGNTKYPRFYIHYLLLPLFAWATFHTLQQGGGSSTKALPALEGYQVSRYDKDVIKIAQEDALVYIKPLKGFVYTDHNPLICWTASGYTFQHIREQNWNNIPLFTGTLSRGKEELYTAWWYDNGSMSTISQWSWRWEMLRGHPGFSIINVTANDLPALQRKVADIFALRKEILGIAAGR